MQENDRDGETLNRQHVGEHYCEGGDPAKTIQEL
jgi:hypothetical protein